MELNLNSFTLEGAPPTTALWQLSPDWETDINRLRNFAPRHLLFVCVQNSARSQIAEGIARALAPQDVKISSAGTQPRPVHLYAIQALAEWGIDISQARAKTLEEVELESVDVVISLCGDSVCPVVPRWGLTLHWGLPDPAAFLGDEAQRWEAFRQIRDELFQRLRVVWPTEG